MKLYQVLNDSGNPASAHEDCENLALFWTRDKAEDWLRYLKEESSEACTINIVKDLTDIVPG